MILCIDNYDSFSYNLVQLLGQRDEKVIVLRNDACTCEDVRRLLPNHIVLSPGPGRPKEAGICEKLVQEFLGEIPILGVCLGHQAICEALGGSIVHAKELFHGKQSVIEADESCPVFAGLPHRFPVARYHSLAVEEETLPRELAVTARTADGEVMAVAHRRYPVYGMQFHPESVLTPEGGRMIENFLRL